MDKKGLGNTRVLETDSPRPRQSLDISFTVAIQPTPIDLRQFVAGRH